MMNHFTTSALFSLGLAISVGMWQSEKWSGHAGYYSGL